MTGKPDVPIEKPEVDPAIDITERMMAILGGINGLPQVTAKVMLHNALIFLENEMTVHLPPNTKEMIQGRLKENEELWKKIFGKDKTGFG